MRQLSQLSQLATRMRKVVAPVSVASDVETLVNGGRLKLSRSCEHWTLKIIRDGSFVDGDEASHIAEAFQVPGETSPLRWRVPLFSATGHRKYDYIIEYNWTELTAPDGDPFAQHRDASATGSSSDSVRDSGARPPSAPAGVPTPAGGGGH